MIKSEQKVSERLATCFCGRRSVYRYGLTDERGNTHTWELCGNLSTLKQLNGDNGE